MVWKCEKPRCFRILTNISRPHGLHYFANAKAWMTTEIVKEVLSMLDEKMIAEGRKILLFLDNAPSHPNILQESLKNIKLEFLPKNTTSRLHPSDANIIENFKHKYRNLLIRYILGRIDTGNWSASKVIKDVASWKPLNGYKHHGLRWLRTQSRTILRSAGSVSLMLWLIKWLTMNLIIFCKNFGPTQQSKNF